MNPEPSRKVWFVRIEQTFHPLHYVTRHIFDSRVFDPVLGSVFREREVLQFVTVYVFV
jgi:hypothetical protein